MARDFSAVGSTGSTTSATGSASGSPGSGLFGLPKWVLAMIAAAVAFVVVIAVVVLTSGGSESSTDDGADAIRAAHGPTTCFGVQGDANVLLVHHLVLTLFELVD